ncbi:hypothetical protein Tco_0153454 [Tanacetum coccineum]
MDANKKIDLDNPLYPNKSKIMANIIQNHPLRLSVAASSSVPWIYLGQFWHTLQEDGSKYWLKFMLDKKELTLTLNDFRRIFHLPLAIDNNHERFIVAPKVDVPTTQSQPIESTQGTLPIPQRRSTRLTPPTPIPATAEADDIILQDIIQLSLAEQKRAENVEKVNVNSSNLKQDDTQTIPGTRLEPKSDKESLEVEITAEVQLVNINKEEEESVEDDYELKRREKEKHVEEFRSTPSSTTIRSSRTYSTLISLDTKKLQNLTETDPTLSSLTPSSTSPKFNIKATNRLLSFYLFGHLKKRFMPRMKFNVLAQYLQQIMEESLPKMVDSSVRNYMSGHILHVHPTQATPTFAQEQQHQLYLIMRDNPQLQQDNLPNWLALKYEFEKLHMATIPCRPSAVRPRDQDDPHDDAHPKGENSTKRQKTSEHGTFMFGESSYGQDFESDQGPSMLGNQEQLDDFDFWTDSYATEDDEIPYKKVSQELVDEISHTVDEAKLRKVVDEMLRQQCTSGDEHQYHINHMQNFLKNDIVSCTALVNQDLLHLKKGSSSPEKIVMSLHKFPVFIFPDDDIEERTSRWELGHERKFITKIVARRANGSIVSITKSDCKNLNKNDIEDMYLLIVNHKVDNYAETGLLWSLSVFIRSTNSKKEKRVMRHQEVYKLCDATLKRVLEVLKSYNNDVKHGYVSQSLSNKDAEYLQLFEEEIEERLKHRDQMIR